MVLGGALSSLENTICSPAPRPGAACLLPRTRVLILLGHDLSPAELPEAWGLELSPGGGGEGMGPRRGGTLGRRAILGKGLESGLRATDGDREKERMVLGEHGSSEQSILAVSTEGTDTAPSPGGQSTQRGDKTSTTSGRYKLGWVRSHLLQEAFLLFQPLKPSLPDFAFSPDHVGPASAGLQAEPVS